RPAAALAHRIAGGIRHRAEAAVDAGAQRLTRTFARGRPSVERLETTVDVNDATVGVDDTAVSVEDATVRGYASGFVGRAVGVGAVARARVDGQRSREREQRPEHVAPNKSFLPNSHPITSISSVYLTGSDPFDTRILPAPTRSWAGRWPYQLTAIVR